MMTGVVQKSDVEALIRLALQEDIGSGDITSRAIFGKQDISEAAVVSKQQGIVCGIDVFRYVYEILDPDVAVTGLVHDGDAIRPGNRVILLKGPTISLLSGERTALNFLQRMTGVATRTT